MLWCGTAAAASHHYEALATYNDRVYALVSESVDVMAGDYNPSMIREYDANLNLLRTLMLESAGDTAWNSTSLALHNGKFYIGNVGSGWGGTLPGSVWEVDIAAWTAREVFNTGPGMGVQGLAIANDGTTFLLTADSFFTSITLHVTTAAALSAGNLGVSIPIPGTGWIWGIAWSEADQTLWVMAGTELQARNIAGDHIRTFTPLELGANIGSIAPLEGGGLIYTATDFATTSVGRITRAGSVYTVHSNQVVNLGGDAVALAFRNHHGRDRVLLREYTFGAAINDTVFIYDPNDFSTIYNIPNWTREDRTLSNIRALAILGNNLFLGTYNSYIPGGSQESGLIARIDMRNLARADGGSGGGGGGSSGCNSGFGLFTLLLVAGLSLLKTRRK